MHQDYDYIIIGAGSAGCVLAHRLSEDETCRVALIEAGTESPARLSAPPAAALQLQNSPYDWAFSTVAQKHLLNRSIAWPRGKTLGGSSVLNYVVYIRGNRGDYDHWAELGAEGWDYDSVLGYFRKAENNVSLKNDFHGHDGPLHVEDPIYRHEEICQTYFESAAQAGIPFNPDVNGERQEGCGYFQTTTRGGSRASAFESYVRPALSRPNLRVLAGKQAIRINTRNGRATGVTLLGENGALESVHASSEVICAAGSIGSPHLLMHSGIGPAHHLKQNGIAVIQDHSNVGQNLQDHLGGLGIRVKVENPDHHFPYRHATFDELYDTYSASGRGPLTTNNLEAGAFVRLAEDSQHPDTQLFCVSGIPGSHTKEEARNGSGEGAFVYLASYTGRPKSTGSISLASNDPLVPPRIDPNYLSEAEDLEMAVSAIRCNLNILAQKPFARLRDHGYSHFDPSPTDDDLQRFVRENATTVWHPTSTCRMGSDETAVVNNRLQVQGVEGLRVCDASVMPTLVTGNTNAPTIMIAEKAADLILGRM